MELPGAPRTWQYFPDSDVPVRIGSQRTLPPGVFRRISAPGLVVYLLLQELPLDADDNIDDDEVTEFVNRLVELRRIPPPEILVSEGTKDLMRHEIALYGGEPVDASDEIRGVLICGARSWLTLPEDRGRQRGA